MPFGKIGSALKGAGAAIEVATGLKDLIGGAPDPYTKHMKRGIQWRVEDAKRAGIHPVYALGANVGHPIAGQHASGSGLSSGLDALGDTVAGYGREKAHKAAQARTEARVERESVAKIEHTQAEAAAARARAQRDIVFAQAEHSRMARAAQASNRTQDGSAAERTMTMPHGDFQVGKGVPAQRVQDEYGDIAEQVYGLGKLFWDGLQGVGRGMRSNQSRSTEDPMSDFTGGP